MKKPIFLESADTTALRVLSECVTHFLCCFNYSVSALTNSYEPPYMTNIVVTPYNFSFTIVGNNQLSPGTVEVYERHVNVTQSIWEDAQGVVKVRINFPDSVYSFGASKVYLSPCVVLFLHNNVSTSNTNITIRTKSPLSTSLDTVSNRLLIEASSSNLSTTFSEPRETTSGILAINGIRPAGGNIQLTGVGSTTVTVAAAEIGG